MISSLVRVTVKDLGELIKFMEHEIYLPNINCLSVKLFQDIHNQEIVTILVDWKSKEAYDKFMKSTTYKKLLAETSISLLEETEVLNLLEDIKYQSDKSKLYNISKVYVKDLKKFQETTNHYFTEDRMKTTEILGLKIYTRLTNEQIQVKLYNWRTTSGIRNFRSSNLRKNEPLFPEYGVDTYPMSELVLELKSPT